MYYFWIFLLWIMVIGLVCVVAWILRDIKDISNLYTRVSRLEESVIEYSSLSDDVESLFEDVTAVIKRTNQMSNLYNKAIMEARYNESVASSNSVHEEE